MIIPGYDSVVTTLCELGAVSVVIHVSIAGFHLTII